MHIDIIQRVIITALSFEIQQRVLHIREAGEIYNPIIIINEWSVSPYLEGPNMQYFESTRQLRHILLANITLAMERI